jgi:hypothetical protein
VAVAAEVGLGLLTGSQKLAEPCWLRIYDQSTVIGIQEHDLTTRSGDSTHLSHDGHRIWNMLEQEAPVAKIHAVRGKTCLVSPRANGLYMVQPLRCGIGSSLLQELGIRIDADDLAVWDEPGQLAAHEARATPDIGDRRVSG